MKHIFFKISKVATGIALSAILILATTPVLAKSNKKEAVTAVNLSPTVAYAGTDNNSDAYISVSFETPVPVRFEVVLSDAQGNEFFTREFEASKFSKYFKLVNEGGESEMNLILSLRLPGTNNSYSYGINGNLEQVSSVAITKI